MQSFSRKGDALPDGARDPNSRDGRVQPAGLLARIGVGACAVAALGSGLVTLEYLKPKVLFEPPTTFRAGRPLDYPEGTVRFHKEQKAYVVGGQGGSTRSRPFARISAA